MILFAGNIHSLVDHIYYWNQIRPLDQMSMKLVKVGFCLCIVKCIFIPLVRCSMMTVTASINFQ